MPSLVDVVVLGLAAWRIGSLVHYERGPYRAFQRLRERLGIAHNGDGEPIAWPDTESGRLLACLDCGSVWVGAGLVGLYLWSPGVAILLALPFALSAIAIAMGRWVRDGF